MVDMQEYEFEKHPLISVIVPVYNVEKYLRECVDSILNQTYRNLQVILVDDGSPDNSPQVCDEYAQKDNRVEVIHKKNGGLSSARNAGIDKAKGEWILFVDSDDKIDTTMIEQLLQAAIPNNVPLAICSSYLWKSDRTFSVDAVRETGKVEMTTSHQILINACSRVSNNGYNYNLCIAPWNKLFYRPFFSEMLRFQEGIIHEDQDMGNKLYVKQYPVAVLHKALYFYRQDNPTSILSRLFHEDKCIIFKLLTERVNLFEKMNNQQAMLATAKTCVEMYIDYYYKALKQGHPEWVTKYKKDVYIRMRKVGRKGQSLKDKIRYMIFDLFPKYYRKRFQME